MKAINQPLSYYAESSSLAKLASISFGLHVFFVFFGTKPPFPDPNTLPDLSSGNLLNQMLALFFVLSMISLWGKQNEVFRFIREEKFLTLLLIWSFCSVFWSMEPTTSLKRWIALFGEVIVCLAALLHFRWSEVALRHLRVILMLYLPISLFSVLFIHGATQWEFPAWRGLEDTKNNLGQITIFASVIMIAIASLNRGKRINLIHYALALFAIVLVIGSKSTTSLLVGVFLLIILGALYVGRLLAKGFVGLFYACVLLLGAVSIVAIVSLFSPELLAQFFGFFGKDLTFTGRVDLWQAVIRMAEDRTIRGWGLGGFWIMDSPHLIPIFYEFVWIPNQSHQGYIDTYSQMGLVGLSLLILVVISYFRGLAKLKKGQVWKWIFMGLLIMNFQESIFFRPRHVGNFLFVFSYIALFTDLIKEKQQRASAGAYVHGKVY